MDLNWNWESILSNTSLIVFGALLIYLFTKLCGWAMDDATARGKSPALVFIAVFFFFPYGLIAWLLFRPDPKSKDRR